MAATIVPLFGHLGATSPNDPLAFVASGQTIRAGAPKPVVVALQQLLATYGFDPGKIDGIYGANTAAAVKALQQKLRVGADGIFGRATAAAIQADLSKGAASMLRGQTPVAVPAAAAAQYATAAQAAAAAQGAPIAPQMPAATLPATAQAQAAAIPWLWILGGAAALFALYKLTARAEEPEAGPYAPPGSVVADLGEDDYEDEDEDEDEELAGAPEVAEPPPDVVDV